MNLNGLEFGYLCKKIETDCKSIRRTIFVIYVELAIFILAGVLQTGIEIGKKLCK